MYEIEYFKSRKAKNRPIFSLIPNGNKHDKQRVNTILYTTLNRLNHFGFLENNSKTLDG